MERAAGAAMHPRNAYGEAAHGALADTGLLVMIVENDHDLRSALVQTIESWGVDTLEAETAEAAIHLLDDIGLLPDVAVLDHQLGDGATGLDLARHLQTAAPEVTSCILSADRSAELRLACGTLGLPLMQKPVDTVALRAFLRSVAQADCQAVN